MLKNYFLIAWRNLSRHKVYTVIHVLGLALGTCACIVIFLITKYEFSFDRSHPDGNRIFRIVGDLQKSSGEKEFLNSPVLEEAAIEHVIPGFEAKAAFFDYGEQVTIPDGSGQPRKFDNRIEGSYSSSTIFTKPAWFDVFQYQWLEGSPQVLDQPFRVVLTEKRARKYFGDISLTEMMGRTVVYQDSLAVIVGGIVKDWPGNTDFGYTDMVSIATATNSFLRNQQSPPTADWTGLSPHSSMAFVKLQKGTTAAQIDARFADFVKTHVRLHDPASKISLFLQPLEDIHFTRDFHRGDDGDLFRKPYMPTLYALMAVAVFILVIAVANFVNLSTAGSIQRAKEIGVRKVLGGNRRNITLQFLTETFMLTGMAVFLSILLVGPVLSLFKDYIPQEVAFRPFEKANILFLLGICLFTTLVAGFYPARVLASFLPALTLKGVAANPGSSGITLRKALILFQFTISLIFIIGTLVIGKQISYMRLKDKGFNSDAIIVINKWRDPGLLNVFANNIKSIRGIDKVVLQGHAPMGFAQTIGRFSLDGRPDLKDFEVHTQIGDEYFIPFYHMRLVAGRNILHGDSLRELVINETLSRFLGFPTPADAIGRSLTQARKGGQGILIVGVVADFHTGSFHEAIHPTVIQNIPDRKWSVAIKLSGGEKNTSEVKAIIAALDDRWKKLYPETPFNCNFLNESITWLFAQEENTAWLVRVAMIIAIFISGMGLFGLGLFNTERRTREIGIRKVLGASIADITMLLNREFAILVGLAFVIASPLAWYFMHKWLDDFAYRTTIDIWLILTAGVSALFIALLTVSFQAVRAARANPVKALRSE